MTGTAADMSQRIESPNEAEVEWLAAYVEMAPGMAAEWLGAAAAPLEVDDLDALWAAWLAASAPAGDANDVVHAVGLAFGQRLVDDLGMRWVVITDELGTEIAVHAQPGDVLVFPANLVAKRWESRATGFLRPVYDEISARIEALRA